MFDDRHLADAVLLIDDWQAGIEERARQARALSARLDALTETARSPDGQVTVTVGATGTLIGLELDERIRNRSAATTAREILATLRAARAAVGVAVEAATAETVGAGTATGRAVIAACAGRRSPGAGDE